MGRSERDAVAGGRRLYEAVQGVAGDHARAVAAVRAALEPIHDELVRHELDAIPVARLKDLTEGRLRLGEVEKGGFRTVGQVLDAGAYRLRQLPGVGQQTADQTVAAARRIADAVRDTVAVHIDVDRPEPRGGGPPRWSRPCTCWWRRGPRRAGPWRRPPGWRSGSVRCWPRRLPRPGGCGCCSPGGPAGSGRSPPWRRSAR
ncbi:hypothetical protein RKD41_004608 [Streptomyces tendae]